MKEVPFSLEGVMKGVPFQSKMVYKSFFQNYTDPDDHTRPSTDTPGFKLFTINYYE